MLSSTCSHLGGREAGKFQLNNVIILKGPELKSQGDFVPEDKGTYNLGDQEGQQPLHLFTE